MDEDTVTINCQYFARPGGKKEYKHTKNVIIAEDIIDTLNAYSGSIGIEGGELGIKAAINTTWSESLSDTKQTKKTETAETENCMEYYKGVGLVFRKMTYTFRIKGNTLEKVETEIITTYPSDTKYFSPSELREEAKADMLDRFGIKNNTEIIHKLNVPSLKEKDKFIEWKISHKGEPRPEYSVYSGTGVMNDGRCYVARFNNVPGKVNVDVNIDNTKPGTKPGTKPVTLCNFWCPGFWFHRHSGEVLTTNCKYKWQRISKGDIIPAKALGPYKINTREFSGGHIQYAWVARGVSGEPGRLTCDAKYYDNIINGKKLDTYEKETYPRMHSIKAHASWFTKDTGEILVIDEDSEKVNSDISGYAIMDGNTTRYDLEK
jgi:hypothetical protein